MSKETGLDMSSVAPLRVAVENSHSARPWSLSRVEIRAPASKGASPVARIELEHESRGRVTDLASAPGALDAAFAAVSQIIGLPGRVERLEMQYVAPLPALASADAGAATVLVDIEVAVDGERFAGRASAGDVLPGCVSAYINALSHAEAVRQSRPVTADSGITAARAA